MSSWAANTLQALSMIKTVYLEAAPFIVIGLFLAGWLKVLVQTPSVFRFLGGKNLKSALYAWLFGMPLPVCSCGVVPLSLGLRQKRASRESLLAFLIGTPETSVGAVTITWGLLGPLMAIVRPIASLLTALFAAVISIGLRTVESPEKKTALPVPPTEPETSTAPESPTEPKEQDADGYHVVGLGGFIRSIQSAVDRKGGQTKRGRPATGPGPEQPKLPESVPQNEPRTVPLRVLFRDANRYAFKDMLDEISIWLTIGIISAGIVAALVPADWVQNLPGGELGAMLLVLVLSVPLYGCAVESTPVAASLVLKGLSPGAALVLLLAGPASNLTTLVLLKQHFGKRFLAIYLFAIAAASIGAGLAFNALLRFTGWQLTPKMASVESTLIWQIFTYGCAAFLLLLLLTSFVRMNWRHQCTAAYEAIASGLTLVKLATPTTGIKGKRIALLAGALLGAAYLSSGLYQVPLGSAGYVMQLGQLTAEPRPPGLHYHWPWPVEKVAIRRVSAIHKTDVGFRTDLALLKQWKRRPAKLSTYGWHSFFTTMHPKPEESLYLLGDENQLELKFSIHYRLKDPTAFYFNYAKNADLVSLAAESVLRTNLASQQIDDILTDKRRQIAGPLQEQTQKLLDSYGIGVEIVSIWVVDLHPPEQAVAAFRDVASAMENRETRIHRAYAARSKALPKARGEAAMILAESSATAIELTADSRARSESFAQRSQAHATYPAATQLRMWLETMERVLARTAKTVAPPEATRGGRLRIWNPSPTAEKPAREK